MTRLMPSHLSRWLWIGVAAQLAPSSSQGQKPGQPYVSPLKNFSITVPNYAFGTKVQKSNKGDGGFVGFICGVWGREGSPRGRWWCPASAAPDPADTAVALLGGPAPPGNVEPPPARPARAR